MAQAHATTLKQLRAMIEHELGLHAHPASLNLAFNGDTLVLSGEVQNIAQKRMCERMAEAMPDVARVEDRLQVMPSECREDGAIRDSLASSLSRESALHNCSVGIINKGVRETINDATAETACYVDARIEEGVITLLGEVISLTHKRLVGILAWWIPGVRNVENLLTVVPHEADTDDEITDAVRLAFAKDPLVHGDQIRVSTRDGVVTLEGLVAGPTERQMAEHDVWYLSDVAQVSNQLQVRS